MKNLSKGWKYFCFILTAILVGTIGSSVIEIWFDPVHPVIAGTYVLIGCGMWEFADWVFDR